MTESEIKLEPSWKSHLGSEFQQCYMRDLKAFLKEEKSKEKIIYPSADEIFSAFAATPFDKVKVVILGQDPYHGPDQAHGLSFSVPDGIAIPPSLQNIYKEMEADLGIKQPSTGYLMPWAEQGVLLLNSVLSVEQGKAGSHQGRGWEEFTDKVIGKLNAEREGVVFLLWGNYAQKKGAFLDSNKHLVLKSVHPSPLSAYRGFFGCKHFSKTNEYLQRLGKTAIEWQL